MKQDDSYQLWSSADDQSFREEQNYNQMPRRRLIRPNTNVFEERMIKKIKKSATIIIRKHPSSVKPEQKQFERNKLKTQNSQLICQEIDYYLKMAENSLALEKYKQSISQYDKLQSLYQKLNKQESKQYADVLVRKAEVHRALKEYEQSELILRASLQIREKFKQQSGQIQAKLDTMKKILELQEIQKAQKQMKQGMQNIIVQIEQNQQDSPSKNQPSLKSIKQFPSAQKWLKQAKKYYSKKKYVQAIDTYQKVYDLYQQHSLKKDEDYAQLLGLMGVCHMSWDSYSKGKDFFQKSLEMFSNLGVKTSAKLAEVLFQSGQNELIQKQYEQAIKFFKRSLTMTMEVNGNAADIQKFVEKIVSIGCDYQDQQDYEKLIRLNLNSVKFFQKLKLQKTEGFAVLIYETGLSYSFLKNYNLSNQYYFRSIKIREDLGRKQSTGNALTLSKLGENFVCTQKYKQAIKYYQDAIKMRTGLGGNDQQTAKYLSKLGKVFQKLQQYDKAQLCFTQEQQILRQYKKNAKSKQNLCICLWNLSRMLFKIGNLQLCMEKLHESAKVEIQVENIAEMQQMVQFLENRLEKDRIRSRKLNQIKKKLQNEKKIKLEEKS